MEELRCPVCGKTVFEEYGDYDICPICKWENDNLQFRDHNYAGGANDLSVNEARIEYYLMNDSSTRERTKELYDEYYDTVSAVREKYKDIDHSSYSGELESDELNAARREYVDKLNGLLLEKLGDENDI